MAYYQFWKETLQFWPFSWLYTRREGRCHPNDGTPRFLGREESLSLFRGCGQLVNMFRKPGKNRKIRLDHELKVRRVLRMKISRPVEKQGRHCSTLVSLNSQLSQKQFKSYLIQIHVVARPAEEQRGTKLVHDATKGRLFDSVGITRDAAGGLKLLPGVPEAEADDELGSFTTSSREGAMFKSADVTTKFWRKSVRVEAFSEVCRESLVFVGNVGIRLGDS